MPNNYQTHTVLTESSVFFHLYFSVPQWMVCKSQFLFALYNSLPSPPCSFLAPLVRAASLRTSPVRTEETPCWVRPTVANAMAAQRWWWHWCGCWPCALIKPQVLKTPADLARNPRLQAQPYLRQGRQIQRAKPEEWQCRRCCLGTARVPGLFLWSSLLRSQSLELLVPFIIC